ncbi:MULTISPECIES: hypothetical protein [unclassified Leucobacter]
MNEYETEPILMWMLTIAVAGVVLLGALVPLCAALLPENVEVAK